MLGSMPLSGARLTGDSCHWRCGGNGGAEPLSAAPTPAAELKAQRCSSAPLLVAKWVCSLGMLLYMGEAWLFIPFSSIYHKIKATFYICISLQYIYDVASIMLQFLMRFIQENGVMKFTESNSLCVTLNAWYSGITKGLEQFSHDKIILF